MFLFVVASNRQRYTTKENNDYKEELISLTIFVVVPIYVLKQRWKRTALYLKPDALPQDYNPVLPLKPSSIRIVLYVNIIATWKRSLKREGMGRVMMQVSRKRTGTEQECINCLYFVG